jgi:type II secretory pathway predicted ATPase ExeA
MANKLQLSATLLNTCVTLNTWQSVDDPESKQPLADDLSFLADLERGLDVEAPEGLDFEAPEADLDRGFDFGAPEADLDRGLDLGAPEDPDFEAPEKDAGGVSSRRRRPLLDLFPPTPAEVLPPTPIEHPTSQHATGPAASPAPRRRLPAAQAARPRPDARRSVLAYEAFYGLNETPFSLASDPKFLYHSASHDRAAQEILSAIVRRDAVVMLTGEMGSGKTTLCRAVGEEIDRRTFTAFVLDPFVGIEDLLKSVLIDFGVVSRADVAGGRLSEATRYELTIALKEFLLSLVPLNGFAVIFIDEAQSLSPEMLDQVRGLSDIESDKSLMQIVLVGQPALVNTLRRQELNRFDQRVSVRCALGPLAEAETASYVSHRLAVAGGGQSRVEFDDDAFTLIYDLTRGLPRLVNRLCDRVLALGYEQSADLIDAVMVEAAARDIDLIAPEGPSAKMMRLGVGAALLVVLTLLGAGAATLVFRAQLGRAVAAWQAVPPPPPPPALTVVGPIESVAEPVPPR